MTADLTPEQRAAEVKRQAAAAFVVAVDLAKAGGLSQDECHEVVDDRPHVEGEAELGRAALSLLRSFVAAGAKQPGGYGLTAEDMIRQARTLLDAQPAEASTYAGLADAHGRLRIGDAMISVELLRKLSPDAVERWTGVPECELRLRAAGVWAPLGLGW